MGSTALVGAEGPLVIVGFSMGGLVGLEILRQEPKRVRGIAFISADLRQDTEARILARQRLFEEVSTFGIEDVYRRMLRNKYFPSKDYAIEVERTVLDMMINLGPAAVLCQLGALNTRSSSKTLLRSLACPTLFLSAADDSLCPVEAEAFVSDNTKHATCIRLSSGGHFLPLTEPIALGAALSNWLSSTLAL